MDGESPGRIQQGTRYALAAIAFAAGAGALWWCYQTIQTVVELYPDADAIYAFSQSMPPGGLLPVFILGVGLVLSSFTMLLNSGGASA